MTIAFWCRLLFSIAIIGGVYLEAGKTTALFAFLVAVAVELQQQVLARHRVRITELERLCMETSTECRRISQTILPLG